MYCEPISRIPKRPMRHKYEQWFESIAMCFTALLMDDLIAINTKETLKHRYIDSQETVYIYTCEMVPKLVISATINSCDTFLTYAMLHLVNALMLREETI